MKRLISIITLTFCLLTTLPISSMEQPGTKRKFDSACTSDEENTERNRSNTMMQEETHLDIQTKYLNTMELDNLVQSIILPEEIKNKIFTEHLLDAELNNLKSGSHEKGRFYQFLKRWLLAYLYTPYLSHPNKIKNFFEEVSLAIKEISALKRQKKHPQFTLPVSLRKRINTFLTTLSPSLDNALLGDFKKYLKEKHWQDVYKIHCINLTDKSYRLRIRYGEDDNIGRILIPAYLNNQDLEKEPNLENFIFPSKTAFKFKVLGSQVVLRLRLWEESFNQKPDIQLQGKKIISTATSKENQKNSVTSAALELSEITSPDSLLFDPTSRCYLKIYKETQGITIDRCSAEEKKNFFNNNIQIQSGQQRSYPKVWYSNK